MRYNKEQFLQAATAKRSFFHDSRRNIIADEEKIRCNAQKDNAFKEAQQDNRYGYHHRMQCQPKNILLSF